MRKPATKNKGVSRRKRRSWSRVSKKRKNMGFQIEHHNSLTDFQKLGYIAAEIRISRDEIAKIVEEDPSVVNGALNRGSVPAHIANAQEISDKLYQVRMLFSSLLRLCQYSDTEANRLLSDTTEFKQCLKPPPWYPRSLREYITSGKIGAVHNALLWLRTY